VIELHYKIHSQGKRDMCQITHYMELTNAVLMFDQPCFQAPSKALAKVLVNAAQSIQSGRDL
jgi:hypothetical protein